MGKIFISYVRNDSEADTGRLVDTLTHQFPDADFFIDVRNIELGTNWKRSIERAIEGSTVLLCAMGPQWKLSPAVELELELAFKSNISVVPIIFRNASLENLTEGLRPGVAELRDRNAIVINHGSWQRDIAPLVELIDKILHEPSRARVIIAPPDPKLLLDFVPSTGNGPATLLNYAQDLAECLADENVYKEADEGAVYFEEERKAKVKYDMEISRAGFFYRNIKGAEPKLVQIVKAAKKRLEIEQSIRELLSSYRRAHFEKVAQYLDDGTLLRELTRLYEQYTDAVQEYKDGGTPYPHPTDAAKEFDVAFAAARKRLEAEIPGITKRFPDRKWP